MLEDLSGYEEIRSGVGGGGGGVGDCWGISEGGGDSILCSASPPTSESKGRDGAEASDASNDDGLDACLERPDAVPLSVVADGEDEVTKGGFDFPPGVESLPRVSDAGALLFLDGG